MKENSPFTMGKMKINNLGEKLARNVQNPYHKIILLVVCIKYTFILPI